MKKKNAQMLISRNLSKYQFQNYGPLSHFDCREPEALTGNFCHPSVNPIDCILVRITALNDEQMLQSSKGGKIGNIAMLRQNPDKLSLEDDIKHV